MGMLGPRDLQGTSRNTVLKRMMQPQSVAIIGMSTKPNTVGHLVLQNIRVNGSKATSIWLVEVPAKSTRFRFVQTSLMFPRMWTSRCCRYRQPA